MIIILLIIVSALTYCSLRLMHKAVERREFSFMLAGTLVALAAGGIIAVYTLMIGCVGYLSNPYGGIAPTATTAYMDSTWVSLDENMSEFPVQERPIFRVQ
jgi:uncharacterized oligopeptide transporter (OPT) family protein